MIFTDDSAIVLAWVRLIKAGTYQREQVPPLGNLQEIVCKILDNN